MPAIVLRQKDLAIMREFAGNVNNPARMRFRILELLGQIELLRRAKQFKPVIEKEIDDLQAQAIANLSGLTPKRKMKHV
jgi:hypothetical protein